MLCYAYDGEIYTQPANGNAKKVAITLTRDDEITKLQDDIEEREFSATAGGGAVEVVLYGKKTIKSLTIKPEVVDKDDVEMLQDLVISAVNEAIGKIEETTEEEMSKITGGVSLPGLF